VASPSQEPVPPTHLLEGTSLLDLRDIEVALRAGFGLAIFDALQKEVESFVAAGCPLKRDKKLRTTMTNAISLSFAAFRGADQWQAARQGAIQRAMEDAGPDCPPQQMPDLLKAAFFVAAAKDAELSRHHREAHGRAEGRLVAREIAEALSFPDRGRSPLPVAGDQRAGRYKVARFSPVFLILLDPNAIPSGFSQ
jgi:hypothetical protein